MTKPFNSAELLARLRTALRHIQPQGTESIFRSAGLEIDLSARLVRKRDQATLAPASVLSVCSCSNCIDTAQ